MITTRTNFSFGTSVSNCFLNSLLSNVSKTVTFTRILVTIFRMGLFFHGSTALAGQGLLFFEVSRSYSDTPHTAWLVWTSDRSDTETSTWQHTTLTKDRLSYPGAIRTRKPLTHASDRAATGIGLQKFPCLPESACVLHLPFQLLTVRMLVKAKVKFSLEQATKAQRWSRGIALLFL